MYNWTIGQGGSMDKKQVPKFQPLRVPFLRKAAVFRKKLANSNQKSTNTAIDLRPRASVLTIIKSKFNRLSRKNESSKKHLGS